MKIFKVLILVFLIVLFSLVIVPYGITILFTPETPVKQSSEKPKSEKITRINVPNKIKVYRSATGKVERVPFEYYVKGVASSEMPSEFEMEALKAQAVAARTYSLSKLLRAKGSGNPAAHPGAPVCDSVHCQVYQTKGELKKTKGAAWMKSGWKKISAAVDDTKGQLLYYKGQLVEQALFHSSSGGKTENCEDVFASSVPYLVSVDSPHEGDATHKNESATFSISEFSSKIKRAYPEKQFGTITKSNIKIQSRTSGGRVDKLKIGNDTLEGRQIREALGLFSANFSLSFSKNQITFVTTGSGHGVGMSQYGANGMAKNGSTYKEILSHYYKGTVIL